MSSVTFPQLWLVAYAIDNYAGLIGLATDRTVPNSGNFDVFEQDERIGEMTFESTMNTAQRPRVPLDDWHHYSQPTFFSVAPESIRDRLTGLVVCSPGTRLPIKQKGRFRFNYSFLGEDPEIQFRIETVRRFLICKPVFSKQEIDDFYEDERRALAEIPLQVGMFVPLGLDLDRLGTFPLTWAVAQLTAQISDKEFLVDVWSLVTIRKTGMFLRASNFLHTARCPEIPELRPRIEFIPIGELLEINEPSET